MHPAFKWAPPPPDPGPYRKRLDGGETNAEKSKRYMRYAGKALHFAKVYGPMALQALRTEQGQAIIRYLL